MAPMVHEIIISTDDDEVTEQFLKFQAPPNVKLIRRPLALCQTNTPVKDLIDYAGQISSGDVIFWLHATAPFVDHLDYKNAIELYESAIEKNEFDSVISVNAIQNFIWDDKSKNIINSDRKINPWPNTQDLTPLYEINHAFYISSHKNYVLMGDRIGKNPALFVCDGVKSIDIDWPADFEIAQQLIPIYENKLKQIPNNRL